MKKFSIPNPQGWLQGGSAISRIGMHGRKENRRTVNPIDWIKNVKVTSWSPDVFGEEIALVNDKFSEVEFSSVDMSQRKAVVSLHGPWGESGSLIFMKIDLKFPVGYPHDTAAVFTVQKTSLMTDDLCAMLSNELRLISSRYEERKRGCLEAAVRYLLREQDMEQILSWILDDTIDDSKMTEETPLPDDLSSDEDDGDVADFQGATGMINSTEILTANVLVPVPKGCGALWTSRGQLVCFFPPKPKHPVSFLDLVHSRSNDSDKNDRVFEGFGRLHAESPAGKMGQRSSDDGQSPPSDHSSSYSSASSQGSGVNVTQPMSFYPRTNWRAGAFQRARSADQSTMSLAGQSKARMTGELGGEVISIHDLSGMLPSRLDLANEYKLFGQPSEVCTHNSEVALKYGLEDISLIWRLVKMIVWGDVPLKSWKGSSADPSDVLLIARAAVEGFRDSDSGVDVSFDGDQFKGRSRGRVRWGEGILGGAYLVPALFAHFEGLGDVQMLAMLACVFAEPKVPGSQTSSSAPSLHQKAPAFSVDYYPSMDVARSVRDQLSMTSFAVTTTHPLLESTEGQRRDSAMHSNPPTPHSTGTTPPILKPNSDPPREKRHTSRATSADMRDYPKFEATSQATAVSVSSSPNQSRLPYRSSTNALTPAYSNSPPKPISSSGTKKSSPIGSLVGQHVNAAAVGWAAAGLFGGPSSMKTKSELVASGARGRRGSARSSPLVSKSLVQQSLSSESDAVHWPLGSTASSVKRGQSSVAGPRSPSGHLHKRRIKTRSTLYNQTLFDEDGYSTIPLLDPASRWKFRAYRVAYAAILGVWGLHTQRTEILKFDNFPTTPSIPLTAPKFANSDQSTPEEAFGLGLTRRTTLNLARTPTAARKGLEIRRICHQCNELLAPIEKNGIPIGWHCQGVCAYGRKGGSTRTICTICTKSIFGVIVPCVSCGHLLCFDCLQAWVARGRNTIDEDGEDAEDFDPVLVKEMSCPTGCGCTCSIYRAVNVIPQTPGARRVQDVMKQEEQSFDFNAPSKAIPDAATDVISPKAAPTNPAFLSLSRVRSDLSGRAESDRGARRNATSYFSMSEALEDEGSTSGALSPGPRASVLNGLMDRGLGAGPMVGGGLGLGLRERGDATPRRESEAQATLRKAGIMYNV